MQAESKGNHQNLSGIIPPTLSDKAKPSPQRIPIKKINFDRFEDGCGFFQIAFQDESQQTLAMFFGASSGVPVDFHFCLFKEGIKPQGKLGEIFPNQNINSQAQYSFESEQFTLESDGVQVLFDLKCPAICISRGSTILVKSPTSDPNVGDGEFSPFCYKDESGTGLNFEMAFQERFFGGPEDFGPMLKNGQILELYNSDALGTQGKYRYQSTPYFASNHGWSLGVISNALIRFDFGCTRHEILSVGHVDQSCQMIFYFGQSILEQASNWRKTVSPPRPIPEWTQGVWFSRCYYKDQEEVDSIIKEAQSRDINISVINLDARTWMNPGTRTDFVWDRSRFEDYTTYIPKLRDMDIRVSLWENPYVSSQSDLFLEGKKNGFFATEARSSQPFLFEWIPGNLRGFPSTPPAAIVDFTNPSAREWWKDLHRSFLRAGVSCFKTDFGEEIPFQAIFQSGESGRELRNRYSDLYNTCVTEVLEEELGGEGIVWARSGAYQTPSTPVKWGGDSQSTYRGLRSTLRAGLSQSAGGAIFWSHDIGGFYGPTPSFDLYIKWLGLGLWTSHARLHGTTAREPWTYGEEAVDIFKKAVAVRNHLKPFFLSSYEHCYKEAQSFWLPLWMIYPECRVSQQIDDAFIAGGEILVAPPLSEKHHRSVYLPDPSTIWVDLRTGEKQRGGIFIEASAFPFTPAYYRETSPMIRLFESCRELYI